MINEAAHCFGEGVLRSARDGDIGAIFGLGFPPFRGGPFRYVDTIGAGEVVRRLQQAYEASVGWSASRLLRSCATNGYPQTGSAFYGSKAVAPGQHPG